MFNLRRRKYQKLLESEIARDRIKALSEISKKKYSDLSDLVLPFLDSENSNEFQWACKALKRTNPTAVMTELLRRHQTSALREFGAEAIGPIQEQAQENIRRALALRNSPGSTQDCKEYLMTYNWQSSLIDAATRLDRSVATELCLLMLQSDCCLSASVAAKNLKNCHHPWGPGKVEKWSPANEKEEAAYAVHIGGGDWINIERFGSIAVPFLRAKLYAPEEGSAAAAAAMLIVLGDLKSIKHFSCLFKRIQQDESDKNSSFALSMVLTRGFSKNHQRTSAVVAAIVKAAQSDKNSSGVDAAKSLWNNLLFRRICVQGLAKSLLTDHSLDARAAKILDGMKNDEEAIVRLEAETLLLMCADKETQQHNLQGRIALFLQEASATTTFLNVPVVQLGDSLRSNWTSAKKEVRKNLIAALADSPESIATDELLLHLKETILQSKENPIYNIKYYITYTKTLIAAIGSRHDEQAIQSLESLYSTFIDDIIISEAIAEIGGSQAEETLLRKIATKTQSSDLSFIAQWLFLNRNEKIIETLGDLMPTGWPTGNRAKLQTVVQNQFWAACVRLAAGKKGCEQVIAQSVAQRMGHVNQLKRSPEFSHLLEHPGVVQYNIHLGKLYESMLKLEKIHREKQAKANQAKQVRFKEKLSLPTFDMSGNDTYEVYEANTKAIAEDFLKTKNLTKKHYYIVVETPQGIFCKDCLGNYERSEDWRGESSDQQMKQASKQGMASIEVTSAEELFQRFASSSQIDSIIAAANEIGSQITNEGPFADELIDILKPKVEVSPNTVDLTGGRSETPQWIALMILLDQDNLHYDEYLDWVRRRIEYFDKNWIMMILNYVAQTSAKTSIQQAVIQLHKSL